MTMIIISGTDKAHYSVIPSIEFRKEGWVDRYVCLNSILLGVGISSYSILLT